MTQFEPDAVQVVRVPEVRTLERISEAISLASQRDATVIYSLVSADHRNHLLHEARRFHVSTIDLLGPILRRLSDVLRVSPRAEPGIFRQLDEEYFRRTEAIEFAVKHDDGLLPADLPLADLVLIGVSRTSKTPLSMFLAYRGWRVANVPIVLGIDPPAELFAADPSRVVGLTARPAWLEGVREMRARRMSAGAAFDYAQIPHIKEELRFCQDIFDRGGWSVVDVSHKAIEETAAEVVAIVRG